MIRTIVFLALAIPGVAQEPKCLDLADVLVRIEEDGGKVVGSAKYAGSLTTSMLIVETPSLIALYGFNGAGCYVGQMAVEASKPMTGA